MKPPCMATMTTPAKTNTIELPEAVKDSEAKASFQNGVLELTIPKQEKIKKTTIRIE